ncbi:MAG: type II secretion system protein [Patescibacteria group bacterium]
MSIYTLKRPKSKSGAGFSLIELIVTIGIFSILLAGITFLVAGPFSGGSDRRSTERFAREAVEALEVIKERDWDQLADRSDGTASKVTRDANGDWVVGAGTEIRGSLTRSIAISTVQRNSSDVIVSSGGEVDPSTLKVAITVSASGLPDYVVEQYLTNWESVRMSQQDWAGTEATSIWLEGSDDYFSSTSMNGLDPVGVLKLASST